MSHADDDFKQRLSEAINWPEPDVCENETDYRACLERRNALSRLSYTSNPLADESRAAIDALLRKYETAMIIYNRRFLLKDGRAKWVAKYMAWGKFFTKISHRVAFQEARDHGVLRKKEMPNGRVHFYVVGLEYEVGDNTFTTDRRGRDHRNYVKTIGRQAISVSKEVPFEGEELRRYVASVPTLDPSFHETCVGPGKNAIKAIVMPADQMNTLFAYFQDSPYDASFQALPDPWMGYVAPTASPTNGTLFA